MTQDKLRNICYCAAWQSAWLGTTSLIFFASTASGTQARHLSGKKTSRTYTRATPVGHGFIRHANPRAKKKKLDDGWPENLISHRQV